MERIKKQDSINFAGKAITFFNHLKTPISNLPDGVEIMNPYKEEAVRKLVETFFNKFYSDNKTRLFILGINPGRFGGGITGIAFTDPIRLESELRIQNQFLKKPELSSVFIYEMISAFGGPEKFYGNFYLNALSPLGFTKDGKNFNYYDDKILLNLAEPFIDDCVKSQISFGANRKACICLGEGKNYKYFTALNKRLELFEEIIPLPHPRFIMQYKNKTKGDYIKKYVDTLNHMITHYASIS